MPTTDARDVVIELDGERLAATLTRPDPARGLVVFAHGSGSGRHSPRNRAVAAHLNQAALATLLLDLLTEEEEARDRWTAELRFDIPLLTKRVRGAVDWAVRDPATSDLPIGLFGASTGAAAALAAAVHAPAVKAIVLRGGRPDLAGGALTMVTVPTLMIVGGRDPEVLALNRRACAALAGECEVRVIPGATHLFEEPGALEEVARLARDWFTRHLPPPQG